MLSLTSRHLKRLGIASVCTPFISFVIAEAGLNTKLYQVMALGLLGPIIGLALGLASWKDGFGKAGIVVNVAVMLLLWAFVYGLMHANWPVYSY